MLYVFVLLPVCLVCFRYIESMVHFASIRHPAAILDDLHGKVLNEAYQISKSTVTESVSTNAQILPIYSCFDSTNSASQFKSRFVVQ